MRQTNAGSRRLQLVHLNGRDYFVDLDRGEFRAPPDRHRNGDFARFDSSKGQLLWDQCLIATCSKCGTERVEPRHASGVKCHRCGAWVLV